ncbi:hypothetical protein SLS64_001132 [Diaporthe eres]
MIIVNGVVLHTATAVTAAGSNSKVSSLFITPYAIIERIQITIFCLQEFILSGLYVWKAWRFLAVYRSGGLYYLQVAYKAFVYSVKLKCEVGILNKLVDFVKYTSAKRQQHSSNSFRMTSQIEREWEKTLRTTFGVTGTGLGDDDDEVDNQKQHNQQQQQTEVQQKARQVLGVIDERRSSGSGSTRVDGPSMDGGSGLMVPGGVVLGLRER